MMVRPVTLTGPQSELKWFRNDHCWRWLNDVVDAHGSLRGGGCETDGEDATSKIRNAAKKNLVKILRSGGNYFFKVMTWLWPHRQRIAAHNLKINYKTIGFSLFMATELCRMKATDLFYRKKNHWLGFSNSQWLTWSSQQDTYFLMCTATASRLQTQHSFLVKLMLLKVFTYARPAQPFQCCGPLSHEEIYCGPQRFLWRNKSLDFDKFHAITRGDIESYSCTQCCQLVWM